MTLRRANHDDDEPASRTRLLAKLVRQLLADERFETLGDLVDALKFRCAQLRIDWSNDAISQALALVQSNCRVLVDARERTR